MGIKGLENMTLSELNSELSSGGKFVVYEYCISIMIMTFKRSSGVYYIKPGENAIIKGIPYLATSLALGWWGVPWGPIFTITSTITNIGGGKDVTSAVLSSINASASGQRRRYPDVAQDSSPRPDVAPQNIPPPTSDWYNE